MRVSCPACGAAYEIPDDVMAAGGRRLRCARCAHEWTAETPEGVPTHGSAAALADPEPEDASEDTVGAAQAVLPQAPPKPQQAAALVEPATLVRPPPRLVASPPLIQERTEPEAASHPGNAAIAWAVSVAILAGIGLAAYLFRETIQAAWPPSQVVYAALGLG